MNWTPWNPPPELPGVRLKAECARCNCLKSCHSVAVKRRSPKAAMRWEGKRCLGNGSLVPTQNKQMALHNTYSCSITISWFFKSSHLMFFFTHFFWLRCSSFNNWRNPCPKWMFFPVWAGKVHQHLTHFFTSTHLRNGQHNPSNWSY